ncbi:MAG TPA: response regulator transcription factor [Acidimicrobiales bacterium]|jgi:two-component system response regulator ResD
MSAPFDLPARVPYGEGLRPDVSAARAPAAPIATTRTILVAEDDSTYRLALHRYLEQSGYQVIEAENVPTSLRAVFRQEADLVVLDLDHDGGTADVLTKIRRRSTVPVIVCSGRASEHDRVRLLNLGADDFVVKPYSMIELEARVRAVLRRGATTPATTLDLGDLVIDRGTRIVTIAEAEVTMTRKEFDLLAFLAGCPGRVFSREELLERVWGSTSRWQGCSTVTEHVRRVRLKIESDPEHPRWITTVRGVGYRFCSVSAA